MARWKRTFHGSSRNMEMWIEQPTTNIEASKFWKPLMKRTRTNDLCKVPACSARAWLAHIWKDVPSTRRNQDLLVSCVVRLHADPYQTQRQRFKPIPHMHRSQSQGFGLLKRLLNYHLDSFGFFNFIFLLAMSGLFGCFWSCFGPPWNPEGVKAAWFLARKRLAKVLPTRKLWSSPFLFRRRMLDGKKHSKLTNY